MAYEVYLFRFEETEPMPIDTESAEAVLGLHGICGLEVDLVHVELASGSDLEISLPGIEDDQLLQIGLSFRGISDGLFGLIFDLISKLGLTALVVDDPAIPLLANTAALAHLPEGDFDDPVICSSSADVRRAIEPRFDAWVEWAAR